MSFLSRLFGKRPDPTLDWAISNLPIPDFDMSAMRFGSLQFGDPFEAARHLGRPDHFKWMQKKYGLLLYASRGFQIDYDDDRFAYLAFFLGPDPYLPEHKTIEFSKPRIRGCGPDTIQLTPNIDRAMLEQLLGKPESADTDSEETILFYTRQGVTMEFELDGKTGGLKRWNLYPNKAS